MRSRGGFSLLEILVAILLVGGSLLLAFALFPTSYSSLGQAKNLAAATNLAREVLESQKARGYRNVQDLPPTRVSLPVELHGTRYDQEFTYSSEENRADDGMSRVVTVDVTWQAGRVERRVRLETVIIP